MKLKSSLFSQLFDILLILLIVTILLILNFTYNINPFQLSLASVFYFSLLLIAFFLFDGIVIRKLYTYEIDDAGVKESFILFSKKETLIPYSNITKVDLRKSFVGRLLDYGDIEIVSSSAVKIVIKGVRKPERVYQEIRERLEKFRKIKEKNE